MEKGHVLAKEIDGRCRELLQRLAEHGDVPPGPRLRLEGMLEAAAVLGIIDAERWYTRFEALHREVVKEEVSARAGDDWRATHSFPEVPLYMHRAPVAPSNGD